MRQRRGKLAVAGLLSACAVIGTGDLRGETITGVVTRVSDGDTLKVQHGATVTTIRFHGVDAPEVAHPGKPGQAFGDEAGDFSTRQVLGKLVTVNVLEKDKYGRSVGEIHTGDGLTLNESLVAAGYAWWYADYAAADTHFARLEAEARHLERGLWQQDDPLPPWIFRHPDRRADWEARKCELRSRDCRDGERPTVCWYDAEPGVVFDATGDTLCVAEELLLYQLCRSGRPIETNRIACADFPE